jgi:hypothetical protein
MMRVWRCLMGKNFWKGLGWSLILVSILYFGLGTIYYIGYTNGKESVSCGRAECMAQIIKYSRR